MPFGVEEDVRRLDVTVAVAVAVHEVERFGHDAKPGEDLFRAGGAFGESLLEIATRGVLRDGVGRFVRFAGVVDADDVRVFERGEAADLHQEALAEAPVGETFGIGELQDDGPPVEFEVGCQVHTAHAALAETTLDLVASADRLPEQRIGAIGQDRGLVVIVAQQRAPRGRSNRALDLRPNGLVWPLEVAARLASLAMHARRTLGLRSAMRCALALAVAFGCSHPLTGSELDASNALRLPESLIAADRERADAMVRADAAALERVLSRELRYTHSTGSVDDRESLITSLLAGDVDYLAIRSPAPVVQLHGEVGVIAGPVEMRVRFQGARVRSSQRLHGGLSPRRRSLAAGGLPVHRPRGAVGAGSSFGRSGAGGIAPRVRASGRRSARDSPVHCPFAACAKAGPAFLGKPLSATRAHRS